MENGLNEDHYIFFLKLSEELPEFYFELSHLFSQAGFILVPVDPENLKDFSFVEKKFVLVIRYDLKSQVNFLSKKLSFVEYLLKNSKIYILDIASFGEIPLVKKLRLHKCYQHVSLPIDMYEIVMKMARAFYNEQKVKEFWPGGKRGKFPEMPE